jgi:hypothetical protein
MSKQQTAVEWLICRLLEGKPLTLSLSNQAKQMQKEQIKLAYLDGSDTSQDYIDYRNPNTHTSENYYQQTYGGDHE